MAAQTNARQSKSDSQVQNAFSLPITCQICLGQVRQPVLCPNYHVFCGTCMTIWLEKNQRCPACRIPIDNTNPVRHIRGGLNQTEDNNMPPSTSELRKLRFDLLFKDYESILDKLQNEVKHLKAENNVLKSRHASGPVASSSKHSTGSSSSGADSDRLLVLTGKLQDAQKLYDRVKQDMAKLKQENSSLKDENVNLSRENAKLKEEIGHRSPHRYGRLTVATLESQLEGQNKEIHRLTKALERSDQYIEDLQQRLQDSIKHKGSQNIHYSADLPRKDNQDLGSNFRPRSSSLSRDDVKEMHSNLRSSVRGSTESLDRKSLERDIAFGVGYDFGRAEREVGDAKRQLFTDDRRDTGRDSYSRRAGQDTEYKQNYLYGDVSSNYNAKPPSGRGPNPERDGPESIMKKTQNKLSRYDPSDKLRSPGKKVQFNIQEKKSEGSFDLEVPSPLTPSSSIGKLSLDSDSISPAKTGRRAPDASHFRHSYPSSQYSDSGTLRDYTSSSVVSSSKYSSAEPTVSRYSTMSYNFDDHHTSKDVSKKLIGGSIRRETLDNDSSHLSEPEFNTPQSLTSPEKLPAHRRTDNVSPLMHGQFLSDRDRKSAEGRPRGTSSFDLEGPSLDDTQTIQSELNDLDISMTPELSDCLKLMNRAEKKVHHTDLPDFAASSGTLSMSVPSRNLPLPSGVVVGGGGPSGHTSYPRTYVPGTTGTMSSWEHGFFSTLKVNPYKHAPLVQPHQPLSASTARQPFSRPSSVPPSLGSAMSSYASSYQPSSIPSVLYTQATTGPKDTLSYAGASKSTIPYQSGLSVMSNRSRDDLDIGRSLNYPSSRGTVGNYSYVSNNSSMGDSRNNDSFLPEPKKRLFDTDDDMDLGSPSKTTKML